MGTFRRRRATRRPRRRNKAIFRCMPGPVIGVQRQRSIDDVAAAIMHRRP